MSQPNTDKHTQDFAMLDGNEAAAYVAHALNEVIAIYPITPASPMGEFADLWSAKGQENCWGTVPSVIEMQSEGGAAGAIHGALQAGSLSTTFTASQGLLLMIPNMFKIAGELTPTVFHIAARSVAAQALSIFCDHSDVMSTRGTGFAMLCASNVQEVMDFAAISQAVSLETRVPVLHFFDGFRTSHEIAKVDRLPHKLLRQLVDEDAIRAHRERALSPDHPVLRGSSQNPDVFFQARETVNPYYVSFADKLQAVMDRFAALTGRQYHLFDYFGASDAERVIILMGSACDTVEETVEGLLQCGDKVGVLKVRLYRSFDAQRMLEALPDSVKSIAVLDRTKEPGADGEPLYKDVVTALAIHGQGTMPKVIGGRYGLSSKEFTPGMVKSVFDELDKTDSKNGFTVGIYDDVTNLSLEWDPEFRLPTQHSAYQAVFYGLGSDGTVSANKNSIKIIGEQTPKFAQGYFVYDSKKSGAVTVSHLRFSQTPIRSAYLIEEEQADFVACHQEIFLERYPMLDKAKQGATFLLNTTKSLEEVWDSLPSDVQEALVAKQIKAYVINAYDIAQEFGLGKRINTIMQACFFALTDVLPSDEAIEHIKAAVVKTYGKKSKRIIEINNQAIDQTLARLEVLELGNLKSAQEPKESSVSTECSGSNQRESFIAQVTKKIIAGKGDLIPVSQLPADGTFPTGTAKLEKRDIAVEVPVWEPDLCTHCGKCVFVCPHSVIRSKAAPLEAFTNAPEGFKHTLIKGKDYPEDTHISYQISPKDCTGCSLCVDICPIKDKKQVNRKAINMVSKESLVEQEQENWDFFLQLPNIDRSEIKANTMKGAMLFDPLFEFSGACVGCGETSYLRLASQLFGDRMMIANATGCSSIYGGNLPTTPWTTDKNGRGPAWNNSLFEDNAEFGLGMRVAIDKQRDYAQSLLTSLSPSLGDAEWIDEILGTDECDESEIHEQRECIERLKLALTKLKEQNKHSELGHQATELLSVADTLSKKSVWIVGGDGWAYDIGFGGLDHVLASGKNVNVLVLDSEVYSNTGGQTSKATPKAAVAKFSAAGKPSAKKDLVKMAIDYGNVYVAQVAYGAKDVHTLHAFREAESYPGVSIIVAYSPCIAHGVDMSFNHQQQDKAVKSGHWTLLRYDPRLAEQGANPLKIDSRAPSIPYHEFAYAESRFSMLGHSDPERADQLMREAQTEATDRYERYKKLAEKLEPEVQDSESSENGGATA